MGEHAPLRPSARTRGIDNARDIFAPARHEDGLAFGFRFLPAMPTGEISTRSSLRDERRERKRTGEVAGLLNGAPQVMFGDEYFRIRVREQFNVLTRGEFEVERYQH